MDLLQCVEVQELCDELGLVGLPLPEALEVAERLKRTYRIEAGSPSRAVVDEFDAERIRIWYDAVTRKVIAVVHG